MFESMRTLPLQWHAHNYVVTTETFKANKALSEFFRVAATDDATPQGMPAQDCQNLQEFVLIVEANDYPIHGWLTHPEATLLSKYEELSPTDTDR